ncbi:MAG: putative membrane protein YadS [Oleiphilaceae bacterium]|jgi:uncharacterized membrane protein YadS
MDHNDMSKSPGFPEFLIAFVVLMTINSFILLPQALTFSASEVPRFALVVAIGAIILLCIYFWVN